MLTARIAVVLTIALIGVGGRDFQAAIGVAWSITAFVNAYPRKGAHR